MSPGDDAGTRKPSHIPALLASKHSRPLPREVEIALLHRAQAGDRRALNQLVRANIKFVASVARNYQNRGLSQEDLIQEGAVGLQRAILKFNAASNYRLISYAVWWIRQKMLVALADHSRPYKMPPRFMVMVGQMGKVRQALEQETGRPATLEELAERLRVTPESLEEAIGAVAHPESLDNPVGEEATRMDFLAGTSDTAAGYEETQLERNLKTLLAKLDPTDAYILRCHYGLRTGESETLAQIADHLGLSRERVRQRQEKALAKLQPKANKMKLFTPTRKDLPLDAAGSKTEISGDA